MSQINMDATHTLALLPSASRNASANGAALDMRAYVGTAKVTLTSAAGTGTDPTLNIKLQSSPDGTNDWADIPGAAFTEVAEEASIQTLSVPLRDTAGYVRAVATIAGTTPVFVCAVGLNAIPKYSSHF